jgi:hypothetical protein
MKTIAQHPKTASEQALRENAQARSKKRLVQAAQAATQWAMVLSVLVGFAWLQIQVQQSMRGAAATLILALTVCVEIVLLLAIDRLF